MQAKSYNLPMKQNPMDSLQWSPDWTKIVFNSGATGEYGIWIMNSDGTGQVKIEDGMAPQWSSREDQIVFMTLKDKRFTISVISLDKLRYQLSTDADCLHPFRIVFM